MFIKLWNNYRDSSMIFTEVPCIKCSIYTTTSSTELIWENLNICDSKNGGSHYEILPKCEISVSTSILILLPVPLFSHPLVKNLLPRIHAHMMVHTKNKLEN